MVSGSGPVRPFLVKIKRGLITEVRKKKPNRFLIGILALGVFITSASGCNKYTKHKVLTFFFTGVPPLEEENKETTAEEKASEVSVAKQKRRGASNAVQFSHGPYAARLCDQCHAPLSALNFRKSSQKQKGVVRARTGQGLFVVPLEELCTHCHTEKSAQRASAEGLCFHILAADGKCTTCHNAHQSTNLYMLRAKPKDVCLSCHSEGYIINTAAHQTSKECLSCHNPHFGKNKLMLKKDYHEAF